MFHSLTSHNLLSLGFSKANLADSIIASDRTDFSASPVLPDAIQRHK